MLLVGGKRTPRDGWPFESFPERTCVDEVFILVYMWLTSLKERLVRPRWRVPSKTDHFNCSRIITALNIPEFFLQDTKLGQRGGLVLHSLFDTRITFYAGKPWWWGGKNWKMSEMDGFISSRVRYRAPMVLKIMAIIRPSLFKLLESNSKSSCSRYSV